ncbi:hypothetical protein C8R44DRAFT_882841 [Mycena epipterygia]|nr:hypothetical protein C8R44DRAFT_882841 [Mycena epipterygia]
MFNMRKFAVLGLLFKSAPVLGKYPRPIRDDTVTLSAAPFFDDGDFPPGVASITALGTADDVTTYQIVADTSALGLPFDLSATLIEGADGYTFLHTLQGTTIADLCTFTAGGELGACVLENNGQGSITASQAIVAYVTVTLSTDPPTSTSTSASSSASRSASAGSTVSAGTTISSVNPSRTSSDGSPPPPTASQNAGVGRYIDNYWTRTILAVAVGACLPMVM